MMNKQHMILGLAMAASLSLVALTGCPTPSGTPNQAAPTDGSVSDPTTQLQADTSLNASATTSAAFALNAENDADAYEGISEQGEAGATLAYGVFQVASAAPTVAASASATATATTPAGTASASVGASATATTPKLRPHKAGLTPEQRRRIRERRVRLYDRQNRRMAAAERRAVFNALLGASFKDNGDGTKTKDVTVNVTKTVNGQTLTRSVHVVRTIKDTSEAVVQMKTEFSETWANGASHTFSRDKALQPDGSYLIVVASVYVHSDKTQRVVNWTKTIANDGTVSGCGTVVFLDAQGVQKWNKSFTFSGTEEAQTTVDASCSVPSVGPAGTLAPSAAPSAM